MTPTLATPSPPLFIDESPQRRGDHAALRPGRGLTLEQRLDGALASLRAQEATECPVCDGAMTGEGPSGACRSCGSRLS